MTPAQVESWLKSFVLPLVAGGDVRVHGVLGEAELRELVVAPIDRQHIGLEIAEAREAVAAELVIDPGLPEIDQTAITLAVAVQNLLFLSHPATQGTLVRKKRLQQVAHWSADVVNRLPPAESARELAERHSMLCHLFDLGRDDVRVSFWAGRREFRGAEPPSRLLAWKDIRRVREERWRVTFLSEAVSDPGQRAIVNALLHASPFTDLLEPQRLEPALDLRPAHLVEWLRNREVARAVADRWLAQGLPQLAGPLTAALLQLCNEKDRREDCAVAVRFTCHLHLLALLGEARQEAASIIARDLNARAMAQPALRDFFGVFAAAQRLGLGRPADLGRDPGLQRTTDAYAAACATVAGAARVTELEGVLGRGVHYTIKVDDAPDRPAPTA